MNNSLKLKMTSIFAAAVCLPWICSGVADGADVSAMVPAVMRSQLATLAKSKTPVVLPTWLPNLKDGKYALSEPHNEGKLDYELWIATEPHGANYCTVFYITGGKRRPAHSKRTVVLGKGRTGYLMRANNWRVVEWAEGQYGYRLAITDGLASEADLLRMAKSAVTVSPAAH